MGSGGGGTNITRTEPPGYVKEFSIDMLKRASDLSNREYSPYTGEQVAPLNSLHERGINQVVNRAANGSPLFNNAASMNNRTLNGNFLNQTGLRNIGNAYLRNNIANQRASANPMANLQRSNQFIRNNVANQQASRNPMANLQQSNQFVQDNVATIQGRENAMADFGASQDYVGNNIANMQGQQNALAGLNNPYLNSIINQTNDDITRAFTNSTLPQTDTSFARAGAFGGSAWQQANAENNRQMANELAKNTANLRYGDYQTQVNLAENQAARDQEAEAQNRAYLASNFANQGNYAENLAARQQQADLANTGYIMQNFGNQQNLAENLANRQQQVGAQNRNYIMQNYGTQQQLAENLANRQQDVATQNRNMLMDDYSQQQQIRSQMFGNERDRQMSAIANGQNLSNQVYTDAQNLLGVGDIRRDYQQTLDNQNYQNFLNQQNWPLQNLDVLANAIRTSMGGGGTTTQTATMPSVNRAAAMIGGGMAGAGLGSSLGGGNSYGTAIGGGLGALAGLLG